MGTIAGFTGLFSRTNEALSATYAQAVRGLPQLKITEVRPVMTCPQGLRLVVVRVDTSEPGLYGLGCATFNQRPLAVVTAVKEYLDPFARGRNADNIEDIWQTAYTSSYWRNGPVLNNALSGLDMALWDIKAKRASMPLYQLLGGKTRFAADCYAHSGGRDYSQVVESVQANMERGFRHIRIQLGGYGAHHLAEEPHFRQQDFGLPEDSHMYKYAYLKSTPEMFDKVRSACGAEIELLHDIHERVPPIDAVNLVKQLEQYRPFFIEDPFPPEQNGYFEMLRGQTSVPIAMGELFNNPHEWVDLITRRQIDFIRVHMSQIGGLTPARKLAALGEWFGVRTAWHGPGDLSPVGVAANAHLDLAISNFGIQEYSTQKESTLEVFPGCPTVRNGYLYVSEEPGLGVDLDEEKAARFPYPEDPGYWRPVRRNDGSAVRP
jgi:mannonate dehydratase